MVQGYYMAAYLIGADAIPFDDCFEMDVPIPPPGQGPWPNDELIEAAVVNDEEDDAEEEVAAAAGDNVVAGSSGSGEGSGSSGAENGALNATIRSRGRHSRDGNQDPHQEGMPRVARKATRAQLQQAIDEYNAYIARMQAAQHQR